MVRLFVVLLVLSLFASSFAWTTESEGDCRFAANYDVKDVLVDSKIQNALLKDIFTWEANFFNGNGVGFNNASGVTYDGANLDYSTGKQTGLHNFSASSKECIHVALLALAVIEHPLASLLISKFDALYVLERKISTYERFRSEYPGYGGFLPWFNVEDSRISPTSDWNYRTPALDNGEMIWALKAAIAVLQKTGWYDLAARYQNHVDDMARYARIMFWDGAGRVRSVVDIVNVSVLPFPENYKTPQPCGDPCYLDDPYEGELFVLFMDLYGNVTEEEREAMWDLKRKKLQHVDYSSPSLSSPITVQRGWWFSSHEVWKLLLLPYMRIDRVSRVFHSGEVARTSHSAIKKIPGLFACVTDLKDVGYISATGIQSIAFERVTRTDVVTPYASFPLFIVGEQAVGLAWYLTMIKGPAMQNEFGSTEGCAVNGEAISNVVTWDTKMTTLLAMCGGVGDVLAGVLEQEGVWDRFHSVFTREYERAFPTLHGEVLQPMSPSSEIPMKKEDFSSCTASR